MATKLFLNSFGGIKSPNSITLQDNIVVVNAMGKPNLTLSPAS